MALLTRLTALTRLTLLPWGAWRRETPAHLIGPPSDLGRLLEDGGYRLLETGGYRLLDYEYFGRILEDGGYRLLETGGYRLLEDGTTGYPVEWLTADGNYFATADGVNFGVPA